MESKSGLLEDVKFSAATRCVLKIKLKDVDNPVITAVEAVSNDNSRVTLKPTCLYGYEIQRRDIPVSEIESVKRYKTNFDSPLFEKIRFIRKNISSLRKDFLSAKGSGSNSGGTDDQSNFSGTVLNSNPSF